MNDVAGSLRERMNDPPHQHAPPGSLVLTQNPNPFISLRSHRPRPHLGFSCLGNLTSLLAGPPTAPSLPSSHSAGLAFEGTFPWAESVALPLGHPSPISAIARLSLCTRAPAFVSFPYQALSSRPGHFSVPVLLHLGHAALDEGRCAQPWLCHLHMWPPHCWRSEERGRVEGGGALSS